MSQPWMQVLSGRPLALLDPLVCEVDFREIACSLAQINRYTGHAMQPVSVGFHTLIACDLAPEPLKPWVLLHDGHESRVGDTATPMKEATEAQAERLFGEQGVAVIRAVRKALELAHDTAIHTAAGLALPTEAQRAEIKRIDLRALLTERRDYLAPAERPWGVESLGLEPNPRKRRWQPADKVADELFAKFQRYLPALAGSF